MDVIKRLGFLLVAAHTLEKYSRISVFLTVINDRIAYTRVEHVWSAPDKLIVRTSKSNKL